MIRWLFLLFIATVAVAINAIAIDSKAGATLLIVGNIFVASLFGIWLGVYYEKHRRKGILIYSHALLFLSVGMGLAGIRYDGLASGACNSRGFEKFHYLVNAISLPIGNNASCRVYSCLMIILGILVALPSIKLFYGAMVNRNA